MTKTASAKRKRAEREALKAERAQKRTKNEDTSTDYLQPQLFVENAAGPDRVREAKLYEALGSEDADTRVAAATTVALSLLGEDGVPEPVLQRHLDWRLFRGLASGRAGSRLGYSIVITEVLSQLFGKDKALSNTKYPNLTFEKVLDILQERTKPTGNISGQEERDFFFGQLFGLECIMRADFLEKDDDRWYVLVDRLIKLGNKKVWLRSQCGWIICEALPKMESGVVLKVAEQLREAKWNKTPEGVGIWLAALDAYPKLAAKDIYDPLVPGNCPELPAILKEAFKEDDPTDNAESKAPKGNKVKKKQANWTHQIHFVWRSIMSYYIRLGDDGVKPFAAFWKRCVDDNLFSKAATDGQKLRGFLVMQEMLESPALGDESVKSASHIEALYSIVFSKNAMVCIMNQASHEERFLHRMACKTLSSVEKLATRHSELTELVIENLIANNGTYSFDVRTGQKTVENILQRSKPEMGEELISVLSAPVMKTCTTGKDLDKVKLELRVYVEYLFKLSHAAPEPTLKELTSLAYAVPVWVPENASEFVKELSRSRLQSVFANLSKQSEDLTYLCNAIQDISPEYIQMDKKLKKIVKDARGKLKVLMDKAAEKSEGEPSEEAKISGGLALLYAITIFQLYNAEPDAMQLLTDLDEYQERESNDQEGAAEFLVETLLAMASQESSLLRHVSQQVFRCFTKRVTPKALELLLEVLAADENTQGQQALFNVENGDDPEELEEMDSEDDEDDDDDVEVMDEDDLDSDVELGSDVEFVTLNGDDAADAEGEVDGEQDSSDEDDEEDQAEVDPEEAKNLEAIDDALGKILNSHRLDKDKDAESSDSDSDMSDSEMLAMDDKLADVFKERIKAKPSKKKERKAAKESVVNFKRRVLALLEIYIRQEAGNPMAVAILMPLLDLMRTTTIKSLSDRAFEIIKDYQKRLKKARATSKGQQQQQQQQQKVKLDGETMIQALEDIHEIAGASEINDVTRAAASASLIVASTMYMADAVYRPVVRAQFGKLERPEDGKQKKGKSSKRKKNKKAGAVDMVMDFNQWKATFEKAQGLK